VGAGVINQHQPSARGKAWHRSLPFIDLFFFLFGFDFLVFFCSFQFFWLLNFLNDKDVRIREMNIDRIAFLSFVVT